MRTLIRRLLAAVTHCTPGYSPTAAPLPRRGDAVEAWLRAHRDRHASVTRDPEWEALDWVLDDYRLHADTGTPLGQEACDCGHCCEEVTS
jgi:hypothetical protein